MGANARRLLGRVRWSMDGSHPMTRAEAVTLGTLAGVHVVTMLVGVVALAVTGW